MKKIGILYICTGKYSVFWKAFYESTERFLLTDCEKHYFVFTDADTLEYAEGNPQIHCIYQQAQKWPYATLLKFDTILQLENELKDFDYLYFFNANAEFVQPVTQEMILPREEQGEDLVVVQQAGQYYLPPCEFTYDRNPRSKAFIPYGRGKVYVCGGMNGGTSEAFLRMCRVLSKRIRDDLKRGIVALWHDESHVNKYILTYRHYRMLTPSYVYPTQEWWQIPYEPIIQLRDKAKYFDVEGFKGQGSDPNRDLLERVYDRVCWKGIRILRRLGIMEPGTKD